MCMLCIALLARSAFSRSEERRRDKGRQSFPSSDLYTRTRRDASCGLIQMYMVQE